MATPADNQLTRNPRPIPPTALEATLIKAESIRSLLARYQDDGRAQFALPLLELVMAELQKDPYLCKAVEPDSEDSSDVDGAEVLDDFVFGASPVDIEAAQEQGQVASDSATGTLGGSPGIWPKGTPDEGKPLPPFKSMELPDHLEQSDHHS